jgi:ADP-ribosylglycohydrolase
MPTKNDTKAALFGVAIGDALGVPVEFSSRATLENNPVRDMLGYGTYEVPAGTWSDDSSLTFCLAEALTQGFDLQLIGQNFVRWYKENYWTARGTVFDIGIATQRAILRLAQGERPELAGGNEEKDNGNGSLMRILPLVFYVFHKPVHERYEMIKQVSSITHGHACAVIACFYYLEFAKGLLEGHGKLEIYRNLQRDVPGLLTQLSIPSQEIRRFDRLLSANILDQEAQEIQSSGYVVHTLEASIWCLLTTSTYPNAVLKAVNLGNDTDTTAAVTGGLAGIMYGYDAIPGNWLAQLARKEDIEDLSKRLFTYTSQC